MKYKETGNTAGCFHREEARKKTIFLGENNNYGWEAGKYCLCGDCFTYIKMPNNSQSKCRSYSIQG